MKLSLAILFASQLFAAGPTGPTAGFIIDSRTSTIRPITGVPGALRLSNPISLPFSISAAEFSSGGDIAIVLTTNQPSHLAVISLLGSFAPAIADLGEVADDTRILALNAKGTAAIIYSALLQQVRFVSALNGNPVLSSPISTAALAGPVSAGVLDESGSCAVLGTGSVETLCSDGASRRVLPEAAYNVTALAVANNNRDLWVADAAGKQVLRVSNYAQQAVPTVFAAEADGMQRPVALAISPNGEVVVADSGAAAIFVIDSAAPSVKTIPLDITPSQLHPLTDRSLLLLNDLSALPFTLFATEAMRTYFIPAN